MQEKYAPGEKLRQLRVARKVSQQKLATAIFVKNTTISNWENGNRHIDLESLKLICVYFGVPLTYFSDPKTEAGITNKKLNLKPIIAISGTVALAVSAIVVALAGPQGLLNNACYGEEVCYVIDDPSISEELKSRAINGGTMTNVELELVYDQLEQYLLTESGDVNLGLVAFLAAAGYPDNNQYYVERMLYHGDGSGLPNEIFNLRAINPDNLQYLIHQDDKYMVYKLGPNRFKYEVYAQQSYVLTIDLSMNAFYWNNVKFGTPLKTYETLVAGKMKNQIAKVFKYQNFSFLENLDEYATRSVEGNADYVMGNIAFYDHQTKQTYMIQVGANWDHINGFEFMVIMQERIGIQTGSEYRFALLENFDATYQAFPSFLEDETRLKLLDNGFMETNQKSFFDEIIAPYFHAMGNRPLSLFLTVEA